MKLIIPMSGRGTRLRPHTLTTPKALLPLAGKPILHWLITSIANAVPEKVTTVGFIVDPVQASITSPLTEIAEELDIKADFFVQEQPLGTAHAIQCAAPILEGKVLIAFADTIFQESTSMKIDTQQDGIIWTKQVSDPSAYGVVQCDEQGIITDFIEKPSTFISDQAIIGIYFMKEGKSLYQAIQYLLENDIRVKGEYQLTDALSHLAQKGTQFTTHTVDEWLDCGNKQSLIHTHQRLLSFTHEAASTDPSATLENSVIIPPVYIGPQVTIINSVIGPHVSVGAESTIQDAVVKDTIVGTQSQLSHVHLKNSLIGNQVTYQGHPMEVNLGDFSGIIKK